MNFTENDYRAEKKKSDEFIRKILIHLSLLASKQKKEYYGINKRYRELCFY